MKIVINSCFGGYSLSQEAYEELGIPWDDFGYAYDDDRANPKLVACVEKLGPELASGSLSKLKVAEIPDDVNWYLTEYDGFETVREKHRSWD
jgi:hypothetical protein